MTTFPPRGLRGGGGGSASATGDTPEVPTAQPTPSASAVVATEPSTVPAPVPAPAPESAPPEEERAATATATATAAAGSAPPASPYHPPAAPADASDSAAAALVEPSSSSAVTDASLASPQRPAPSSLTPQKAATIKSDIVGMLSQRTGLGLNVKSPPRALSKEDALSVRVHSSSPLVPSSVLVSPVLRMHLVDSELGSPINPSGEPTTPLQTAPFDLSRRLKSAYAAEWEETLDVEEELGGLLSNRAVLLFELLRPPPSFQFYDERRTSSQAVAPRASPGDSSSSCAPRTRSPTSGDCRCSCTSGRRRRRARSGRSLEARRRARRANFPATSPPGRARRLRRVQIRDQDFRRAARAVPRAHQRDGILVASRRRGHRAPLGVPRDAEAAVARRFRRRFIARRQGRRRYLRECARPSRRERIERERTLGGGWRTAETRLARASLEDLEEVADKPGRLPYETLCYGMNPRAAAAKARAETPARETIVTPGGTVEPTIVKLPHARARVDDCEIPNGDGRTQPQVPASAREASPAAFDAMGRRLAAVFKEGSAHTLKVFDCATGAILASFPGHAAAVYDVSWEPERSSDAEERLGTVDFERRRG